jgi:N-acetylglucosaminyl-diphospho-decaprenol L-rhamnosyltransferase
MRLSAVIVTYNSEGCAASCIAALRRCLPEAEVLVVDNASTDDSCAAAERAGATVLRMERNVGFGRACNAGAERAREDHVLFVNPDVALSEVDEARLEELMAQEPFGLLVPAGEDERFLFTERSWLSETLELSLRALRPRELPRRRPPARAGAEPWVSGAVLLVRRSEFLAIGGFDPSYFLYYEDRDLSYRYRQRGLPLRTTEALLAEHAGGGSSQVSDRRSHIAAFALLGWIQYQHAVGGRCTAVRSWRLLRGVHAAATTTVERAARVHPSSRLRRKSLQMREVLQEMEQIRASCGVLPQSDGHG